MSTITPHDVIKTSEKLYGLEHGTILSPGRYKTTIKARHLAVYLTRKYLDRSYNELADIFHYSDHRAAMHAFNEIDRLVKYDINLQQMLLLAKLKLSINN